LVTIFSFALSACASDPYFKNYEDAFYKEAKRRKVATIKTIIRFQEPDVTIYGVKALGDCVRQQDIPNLIRIAADTWKNLDERCRKALIWHELGHCALDKDHTKTGIMAPILDCKAPLKGVWR